VEPVPAVTIVIIIYYYGWVEHVPTLSVPAVYAWNVPAVRFGFLLPYMYT